MMTTSFNRYRAWLFSAFIGLGAVSGAFAASPAWLTAHDEEIKALISQMTLAEKAGQMTQPNIKALRSLSDIETLSLGSILSGGSSDPPGGNTAADWARLYEDCQKLALKSRLGIPLLYGIDAVHGHNNVLGAVIFPHNIGLGCSRNPELVEEVARITAKELRATGIQWAFAPCVAVPRDIRWGRTYEGYSENPELVASFGLASVRGLQGENLSSNTSAISCLKHFIGDGGTAYKGVTGNVPLLDQGDTKLDETTLRAIHMAGYPVAIDAGAATVMPSFSSWNGVKCTASKQLLTNILKQELGFEGIVVSDYNALDQIIPPTAGGYSVISDNSAGQVKSQNYKKCVEIAINAGIDMVMITERYVDFIRMLQELVHEGKVPMERVDDAVTRILRVKFAHGMMAKNAPLMPDTALMKDFGSDAHRAVARDAVRQSLVLLKNQGGILPLSRKAKRIHVTGRGADDLGMQCGGWTIDWQGKLGEVTTGGTTILAALRASAGPDTTITSSDDRTDAKGADAVVVVIGETPYSEAKGDRAELYISKEDKDAISEAQASGAPVVVILLSGRPLALGLIADQADAIIAAWLPGTEGTGVTDVLFGDFAPSGKLSFTWPRSMDQVPLGHGKDEIKNPLFPFGFGLCY